MNHTTVETPAVLTDFAHKRRLGPVQNDALLRLLPKDGGSITLHQLKLRLEGFTGKPFDGPWLRARVRALSQDAKVKVEVEQAPAGPRYRVALFGVKWERGHRASGVPA